MMKFIKLHNDVNNNIIFIRVDTITAVERVIIAKSDYTRVYSAETYYDVKEKPEDIIEIIINNENPVDYADLHNILTRWCDEIGNDEITGDEEKPQPTHICENCKYKGFMLYEKPCDDCTNYKNWVEGVDF